MKVNTLISTCKKTLDPSVAEYQASESSSNTAGSPPVNKVRDGRRKKAATLSGIVIALLMGSLSVPALAATVIKTFLGTTGSMSPGAQKTWHWNNASATRGYYVDVSPKSDSPFNTPCEFEVIRLWTKQVLNGFDLEREVHYTIKNVGSFTCSADKYLISIN